jgi:hypothetical protein
VNRSGEITGSIPIRTAGTKVPGGSDPDPYCVIAHDETIAQTDRLPLARMQTDKEQDK